MLGQGGVSPLYLPRVVIARFALSVNDPDV